MERPSGTSFVLGAFALVLRARRASALAAAVAAATLVACLAFAAHVASGGAFASRTVVAMGFRLVAWIGIAAAVRRERCR